MGRVLPAIPILELLPSDPPQEGKAVEEVLDLTFEDGLEEQPLASFPDKKIYQETPRVKRFQNPSTFFRS